MTSSAEASKRGWAWPNCVMWVRHTLIMSRREEIWVWGEKKQNYWNICLRKSNRLHTTVQLIVPEVCLMIWKNARGKVVSRNFAGPKSLLWRLKQIYDDQKEVDAPRTAWGRTNCHLPFSSLSRSPLYVITRTKHALGRRAFAIEISR